MKTFALTAIAGAVVITLASCAAPSPAGRIDRNPEMYESLSPKHREEVRDGRISRGMTHEAVLLAWGRPSRRADIVGEKGPVERWDYSGTQPVFNSSFYGRCSPYGRYSRSAFAMGPEFIYVPYHKASVWFINGKVDGWESVR